MKKILFLISTLRGGGAERALCNITLAMPEDVEIDILVNSLSESDYPHNGNVISLNMPSRKQFSLLYQLNAFIKRLVVLRKLKKEKNYDACISFMDSANIANVLTGNKNCKVILSERISLSQCTSAKYKYVVFPLAKMLYAKADYVVSVSKGVEDDLIENFNLPKERAVTIHNGCDIKAIQKKSLVPSSIEIEGDKFYYISVGRLCEQKGQWHLVKAFYEVVKKHPECCLILCGEGPYLPILQQMAEHFKISDHIIFAGFQENPFSIAANCDVFVFPSLYEGFSNVIIENMVCGLPVIATDHRSGAREILAPDTDFKVQQTDKVEYAEYGVIVPVCTSSIAEAGKVKELDPQEKVLAEAMERLFVDEQLRNKYKQKALMRSKDFSIDNIVEQWLGL